MDREAWANGTAPTRWQDRIKEHHWLFLRRSNSLVAALA
jgi:hypothetical protein